jgi:hypothetical protein
MPNTHPTPASYYTPNTPPNIPASPTRKMDPPTTHLLKNVIITFFA